MPYAVETPPAIVTPLSVQQAIQAALPQAADTMPPATDVDGAKGNASKYARADHTHATSVQRKRWSVDTNGLPNRWTFSRPYDVGVRPVVTCTAENLAAATRPFVVNVVAAPDASSHLYVEVKVFQAAQPTLSVLNISLTLFSGPVTATFLNCQAAKPT